jgi:hypothetical protein
MKVLRGTFRLSVVIAILVAVYYGIEAHVAAQNSSYEDWKMWNTLRCGERFLGQDMSSYTSPVRSEVIDIGKAGCSSSTFWATRDEIRMALAQTDPSDSRYAEVFWPKFYFAMLNALALLVFVNLLGLVFLATRATFRWVWAGFR